ncbi:CoA transferase [Bradyrhizobium sp. AUGA SZCCT0431]|nr:CoA transferase [Bradyrhizobium sp. AUGA SZCCT0431]
MFASRSDSNNGKARRPLEGLRIVDFTRVLAGPYCTALLADLGAEVIKVESPDGDDYRRIGPFRNGESLLFQTVNRGKRSIVLDLKSREDLAVAHELIASADALIENFRPGVMSKLGLGYEVARAGNPGLVYVSLSGFGAVGPLRDLPAYDVIVQAMSGLMDLTGEPDGTPTMVGEALGDIAGGLFASLGMICALLDRERTGSGRFIDVALLDSLLSVMPTAACRVLLEGSTPRRSGNKHPLSAPFGIYAVKSGHVAIAVLNDRLFQLFSETIGFPELRNDPRFLSDALRRENEVELSLYIERWGSEYSAAQAVSILSQAGIPAATIVSAKDAWTGEHIQARNLTSVVEHPELGELRIPEQPVRFDGSPRGGRRPAPALDADGEQIRRELAAQTGKGK